MGILFSRHSIGQQSSIDMDPKAKTVKVINIETITSEKKMKTCLKGSGREVQHLHIDRNANAAYIQFKDPKGK